MRELSLQSKAIHKWLKLLDLKKGHCSKCGKRGRTDWAFLRWPEAYTRNLSDYAELCISCHRKFDISTGERSLPPNGAANAAKTHCPNGHPYDEINTRITNVGGRWCRACDKERKRRIRNVDPSRS